MRDFIPDYGTEGDDPLEEITFDDSEDDSPYSLHVCLIPIREPVPRRSIRSAMEPKPRGTVAELMEAPTIVEVPSQRQASSRCGFK